jgi:predicted NBD/HSP70 family sugar kinase
MVSRRQVESRDELTATLMSSRDVGGFNRALILRTLIDNGPMARSDLARLCGGTRATIGSIVQKLLDDNVIEELEPQAGSVGKPARPLWFPPGAGSVVAVELRRQDVRAVVVDAAGRTSLAREMPLDDPSSAECVQATVIELVEPTLDLECLGVGISVPGGCDPARGLVLGSTQVPGAVGAELASTVAAATNLAVTVENDSRCQALAERWFGAAKGLPDFISLQTGEGLGACLLLDGRPVRGRDGSAGEVGHTTVVIDGDRCACGRRGCWETVASLQWLRDQARDIGLSEAETLTSGSLVALAETGDSTAASILDAYANNLAVGIANLQQLLGPQDFIVHGDVAAGGEYLRTRLLGAVRERSSPAVRIRFSDLPDAALLGAAATVLADRLHRG